MSIEVNGLTKKYQTQIAVNRLSFSVVPGEIVGFLGPNGAGKSTTMKMLTGFLKADEGTASVCGFDVGKSPLQVKHHIGYLPENNPLYTDLYIREYLGFMASLHGVQHIQEAVKQVIEKVGLLPEAHKKIHQLSKGYKQRVGLAAALIHDPQVLILDEPTSGLDPNQLLEIRQVIREQGKNKTILFSSHILQEVEAICDRVLILRKGSLVADRHLQDLKKEGNQLENLFRELTAEEHLSNAS